jgi:hypothetical protein
MPDDDVKLPKRINSTTITLLGIIVSMAMGWQSLRSEQDFHAKRLDAHDVREAQHIETLHRLDVNVARIAERLGIDVDGPTAQAR